MDVNRIKDEVTGAINTELNRNNSLSHKVEPIDLNAATRKIKNDGKSSSTNDAWKNITIESLKEKINFLRNQVKSQNRIIELMTLKSNIATEMSKMNASKKMQKNEAFNNRANTILNTNEVLSEVIGSELNERNRMANI